MKYLTVNEAAELLQVDTETVYRWLRQGLLPGVLRIGRTWRIPANVGQLLGNGNRLSQRVLKILEGKGGKL